MQNYRRLFISTLLIALLFGSSLIPLNTKPAYACPVEPPPTLLDLYMGSELTVVADVTSEEVQSKESESENGDWSMYKKHLHVVTAYKGTPPDDLSFVRSEYVTRARDETGAATGAEERWNSLTPGNRYLLFLVTDKDSGGYAEYSSYRTIDTSNEKLYDLRLNELASIVRKKKNQLPALTEWLVRLVEEPETLYDGVADIRNSFRHLGYDDEDTGAAERRAPFVLKDYSSVYLPDVSEALTESQKQRISAMLDRQLQESLSSTGEEEEDDRAIDYELVDLVAIWDREQMTMRANAMMQNSDPADSKRINTLMSFINYAVYDDELHALTNLYGITADPANTDFIDAAEENEDGTKTVVNQEQTVLPNVDVAETAVETPPVEQQADTGVMFKAVERSSAETETPARTVEKPALDPEARRQKRERLLADTVRKYSDRYQQLLAKRFETEETATEPEFPHPDRPIITTR